MFLNKYLSMLGDDYVTKDSGRSFMIENYVFLRRIIKKY